MNELETKQAIVASLKSFADKPLAAAAAALFESLGYQSEKRIVLKPNTPETFVATFAKDKPLNPDNALLADWQSVDFLFQLTDDEVRAAAQGNQQFLFESKGKWAGAAIESYLFFAITLAKPQYTRTELSSITRAVNRLFPMPAMLLFRHGDTLTLAVINRRLHKRDDAKDVLEKVTLIKDIRFVNPHRAHIEILCDLSFDSLRERHDFANFVALHAAWQKSLDSSELNKRFFLEVANWYFWALKYAEFPKDAPKQDGKDHISVIRLITRLMFVWFIKEKGLVPDVLFDERKLPQILNGFAPAKTTDKESVFYKAILQNLFFATLNTEMDKRGWTKEEQNFMAHSLYRFRESFQKPADALDLFRNIPFLNGGLFECLDKDHGENARPRYERIDGFSRREDSQAIVPDFLFFGAEHDVDLSAEYGDKKFKKVKVRGLIHTLNHYKFTVAENTPIEEEIALDPELSGKVFENLLAAYNPETGATARKQTGSFYTPREIVNYMVDEALIASLKTKLETALPSAKDIEIRLRHLFAYNNEPHKFTAPEVDALITAIDSLKSLDPAVGSGAFPMGILHKLVFILGKLDPRNEKWKERQIARVRDTMATAEKIDDATARERAVSELEQQITGINEAFEHNELDYGRKLYLIENCIYGVDIQPIAVQIAKMRFFISLIVEQKIDDTQPNRGVRPLPNLETKFVAANTLIGVNRPGQQLLRNRDIETKEASLREVRRRHFLARSLTQKKKCREQDEKLRAEIAELLKGDGWDTATARKLASWNPYDQNASADFFDREWMFGLLEGFDVLIGNPPYVSNDTIPDDQKARYQERYLTGKRFDLYQCFIECGIKLLCTGGNQALILPNTFLTGRSYEKLRSFLLDKSAISQIVDLPQGVFDNATVDNILFFTGVPAFAQNEVKINLLRERSLLSRVTFQDWDDSYIISQSSISEGEQRAILVALTPRIRSIFAKLKTSETLGNGFDVCDGLIPYKTSADAEVAKLTGFTEKPGWKKLLRGKGIARNTVSWQGEFIKYCDQLWCKRDERFFVSPKVLLHSIRNKSLPRRLVAALDREGYYNTDNLINVISRSSKLQLEFVLGLLNSKVVNFWYRLNYPNVNINPNELRSVPIPTLNTTLANQVVELVTKVLSAKRKASDADTKELEQKIDTLFYEIFSLDEGEIKIIENAIPS
jgi:type I restriction-modification system DNA methylase subunit